MYRIYNRKRKRRNKCTI